MSDIPEIPPAHREAVRNAILSTSGLSSEDADAAIATMLSLGYRVAPDMACNNCGGRMTRSQIDECATVCRGDDGNSAGCGMRHDWTDVRQPAPDHAACTLVPAHKLVKAHHQTTTPPPTTTPAPPKDGEGKE